MIHNQQTCKIHHRNTLKNSKNAIPDTDLNWCLYEVLVSMKIKFLLDENNLKMNIVRLQGIKMIRSGESNSLMMMAMTTCPLKRSIAWYNHPDLSPKKIGTGVEASCSRSMMIMMVMMMTMVAMIMTKTMGTVTEAWWPRWQWWRW